MSLAIAHSGFGISHSLRVVAHQTITTRSTKRRKAQAALTTTLRRIRRMKDQRHVHMITLDMNNKWYNAYHSQDIKDNIDYYTSRIEYMNGRISHLLAHAERQQAILARLD